MKNQFHWQVILLTTALATPLGMNARAGVTKDIVAKMQKLLGHPASVTNVFQVEKLKLHAAAAKDQPWSGSYWPDITGGITNHYRDHGKLGSQIKFLTGYNNAKGRFQKDHEEVCEKYNEWDVQELNEKLSPTEKYDLLLGDTHFGFTKAVMEEMEYRSHHKMATRKRDGSEVEENSNTGIDNNYFYEDDVDADGTSKTYKKYDSQVLYRYWKNKDNFLAFWSGICDGWSPAANYLPRPENPVTVTGALGHQITFYPDDLKALGSYLFARTNTPYFSTMNYEFAGRMCAAGSIPGVDRVGYVNDIRCNDLDPGVWHLALLNRVGIDRMGFMMDIDNNIKINNHPLSSYELTYFNPMTGKEGSMKESIASRYEGTDGYAKRRHPKTVYLLGVKSKIRYLYYVWPEANRAETNDSPEKDVVKEKTYTYDLELDEAGNILGGEWGDRSTENIEIGVNYADQPDFIWMAKPTALAYSEQSRFAPIQLIDRTNPRPFGNARWEWDGKGPLPEMWIRAAKKDERWYPPISADVPANKKKEKVFDVPMEARNSILKTPQPLSTLIYFLFDQARNPNQK